MWWRSTVTSYLIDKRIICLEIPDEYEFMDPVLIAILKAKVGKFLIQVVVAL